MCRRVLIAKTWQFEPYGACSILVLTWMHQWETLLIVLHENQWQDTWFQGSQELFSLSVKRRALGSRMLRIGLLHLPFLCKTIQRANYSINCRFFKVLRTISRGLAPHGRRLMRVQFYSFFLLNNTVILRWFRGWHKTAQLYYSLLFLT